MAADDLDVAVRALGSGRHNKNIRIGNVAEYKKKLDKVFKEKCDSNTGPKGSKSAGSDYYGNNP